MINKDYAFLLNRREHRFSGEAIDSALAGKRVLITGAGGSIGSSLARMVVKRADQVLAVGRSELPIFNLMSELRGWPITPFIGDAGCLGDKVKAFRPDVVIHAAAHKHVGLMESQPAEAFRNNSLATARLLDACQDAGVPRFILISTDKAVNPTSVMGASKRLAEFCINREPGVTICRFGNVLGSSGSLVEILEKDLQAGRPFRLTSPDMTRYFITAFEAVGLVLTSGLLFGDGVFSLDMGSPVRIKDLATALSPTTPIEWTGAGKGEKQDEEVVGANETVHPTAHPAIHRLVPTMPSLQDLVDALTTVSRNPDRLVEISRSL